MTRSTRVIVLSLTSAAVGASLALLFAPQSGERTRRQIRRKAEAVKGFCQDANTQAHELYARGADNARRLLRRVRKIGPVAA